MKRLKHFALMIVWASICNGLMYFGATRAGAQCVADGAGPLTGGPYAVPSWPAQPVAGMPTPCDEYGQGIPPAASPCAPYDVANNGWVEAAPGPVAAACNCASVPPVIWSVGAGALLLFRDNANHEFFSYDSAIETNQLLDARDAVDLFLPGVEARIARFDMCTMRGVEAVYWGLYPGESTAFAFASDVTGDLNPILNFDQLNYNGANASAFVNDALVHRLRSTTQLHNVEINRLWGVPTAYGSGGSPWTLRALAGFRYLNFSESLQFASDTTDTVFTGAANELYYTIDANNNLYGGQLGGYAERSVTRGLSATFCVKGGVYGNDASAVSQIGGAAGTATINNGPNIGREWYVSANKCDVAFLGELNAGAAWQVTNHWRALAQYRVVAVSGVALPTNQIFHDLRGLQDVQLLATNGDLFLHGVFVGAQCAY